MLADRLGGGTTSLGPLPAFSATNLSAWSPAPLKLELLYSDWDSSSPAGVFHTVFTK